MALQTSGPISMADIRTEFDQYGYYTGIPISLRDCYRGGGLVPNHSGTATIPTGSLYALNTISMSNFYGTQLQDPSPGGDGE
jgi:hypothetical protein